MLPRIELPAVGPQKYEPEMLRGRVVLLQFMATWCFPCLSELPTLEMLQKKYGADGFQVISIGMDIEGAKVLEPFAYKYELPWPVLVATDDYREGRTRFGQIGILPANLLFARDGQLITAWPGLANEAELEALVKKALR